MAHNYDPSYEQSFSGSDISIMFIMGGLVLKSLDPRKPFKNAADIQTLTISSTTSVLPIRSLGNKRPITFTKGARTFAGSMIFTVIDSDPFKELFSAGIDSSSGSGGSWHIDEMPPFDILIMASNESGKSGMQLISGVTLSNYGTTYSVDDIFTEVTYTYMAEHVSPFLENTFYDTFLKEARSRWQSNHRNPDMMILNDNTIEGPNVRGNNDPLSLQYQGSQYIQDQFDYFQSSKGKGSVFTGGFAPYDGYSSDPVLNGMA
jgi:hypothetical protein